MNFTNALALMENGFRCTRKAWREAFPTANVWIGMVHASQPITIYNMPKHWLDSGKNGARIEFNDWIGIKDANDVFYPWEASQRDVLANDWAIVDMTVPVTSDPGFIEVAAVQEPVKSEPAKSELVKQVAVVPRGSEKPVEVKPEVKAPAEPIEAKSEPAATFKSRFAARRNRK